MSKTNICILIFVVIVLGLVTRFILRNEVDEETSNEAPTKLLREIKPSREGFH
jgi:hypothetical protein